MTHRVCVLNVQVWGLGKDVEPVRGRRGEAEGELEVDRAALIAVKEKDARSGSRGAPFAGYMRRGGLLGEGRAPM